MKGSPFVCCREVVVAAPVGRYPTPVFLWSGVSSASHARAVFSGLHRRRSVDHSSSVSIRTAPTSRCSASADGEHVHRRGTALDLPVLAFLHVVRAYPQPVAPGGTPCTRGIRRARRRTCAQPSGPWTPARSRPHASPSRTAGALCLFNRKWAG